MSFLSKVGSAVKSATDIARESTSAPATRSAGMLGPGLASAGIQAGSELIGGLVNQAFAKRNAQMQFDNWKKAFDYEAEYNSPKNQLARLYEAGINPLYDSQFGGQIQGGMSTGSLPESIDAPNLGQSFSDALAAFGLALQERQTKVQEKKVGLEEIHTRDEHLKALEDIKILVQKQQLNDDEHNRLQELTASIKASNEREWLSLRDKFLNTRIAMFEAFNNAKQRDYGLKLQAQANVTDRMNAVTNRANFKLAKDKYENYYDREITISEGQLKVAEEHARNETAKLTNSQFLDWFEKFEKRFGVKSKSGISLSTPILNTKQAAENAYDALVITRLLSDRISTMSPTDPLFYKMNRHYQEAVDKYERENIWNGLWKSEPKKSISPAPALNGMRSVQ